MRDCINYQRGITCEHAEEEDAKLKCTMNKCLYKEIDYKEMMGDSVHTYERKNRRVRQKR